MKDYRLEKLAKVLVNYSTKVKPGDNVFLVKKAPCLLLKR